MIWQPSLGISSKWFVQALCEGKRRFLHWQHEKRAYHLVYCLKALLVYREKSVPEEGCVFNAV